MILFQTLFHDKICCSEFLLAWKKSHNHIFESKFHLLTSGRDKSDVCSGSGHWASVQCRHGTGLVSAASLRHLRQASVSQSGAGRRLGWPIRGQVTLALTRHQHRPPEPASTCHWHGSHLTFQGRMESLLLENNNKTRLDRGSSPRP